MSSEIIWLYIFMCVVSVEFISGQFIGSESSGFIEVVVRIVGGAFNDSFTITITTSSVSARGKWLFHNNYNIVMYIYKCILTILIGSGVDFNSNTFTITINAGTTEGRASVRVTCDDEVEGLETFDMILTLTSNATGVTLGRDTCEGIIIDSTGKWTVD